MTKAGWIAALVAAPLVGVLIGAGVVLVALEAPPPKAQAPVGPAPMVLVLDQETYGCATQAIFTDILTRPNNKTSEGASIALMRAVLQGHCVAIVKGERIEVAGPASGLFRPIRFNGREMLVVDTMLPRTGNQGSGQ